VIEGQIQPKPEKPRVFRVRNHDDPTRETGRWCCRGIGMIGFGHSPQAAYEAWLRYATTAGITVASYRRAHHGCLYA
jgi:hypothetical protein